MALRISDEDYEKLNPGQADWDQRVGVGGLNEAEQNGTVDNARTDDSADSADKVKNAEENPAGGWKDNVSGNEKTSGKGKGKGKGRFSNLKKKGPLVGIILTLVGGGIGIGGLLSPALLIVHMKEIFTEKLHDAGPALSARSTQMFYQKFINTKNAFAESSPGKCNVYCKFGTMSKSTFNNLKAKGWNPIIEKTYSILGVERYTLRSITSPLTGTEVTDAKGFRELSKNPAEVVEFKKMFNSRTAYFMNTTFGKILGEKFGLNKFFAIKAKLTEALKAKIEKSGAKVDSKAAEIKASFRESLGLDPIPKITIAERIAANPRIVKAMGHISKFGGQVSSALNWVTGVCLLYNTSKGFTYAVKAAKIATFAGFAITFLKLADQIKAGDADPEIVSQLGEQLTATDQDGNTATDSLGYRMAAFGDNEAPTTEDKKYSATVSGDLLNAISVATGAASILGLTGLIFLKNICRAGANPATIVLAACGAELAVAAGFGASGVGTAAAPAVAVGGVLECGIRTAVTTWAIGQAITAAIVTVTSLFLHSGEVPELDGDTIGKPAGDAIYTGTAQIMGGTAAAYGLKPGSQAEIKQYAIDTAQIRKQDADIAYYEASKTPFDIYNPNSFLGSIAQKLNTGPIFGSSIASSMGKVLSIVPKSFASLTNKAGAEDYDKSSLYSADKCGDTALKSLGIDADAFCNPSYVMSSSEMNTDVIDILPYMIAGDYIDKDTGEAIDNSNNNYKKYLDNCVFRKDPLGETSAGVESANYEWELGTMCVDDSEMLHNFRIYQQSKAVSDTMDEDGSTASQTSFEENYNDNTIASADYSDAEIDQAVGAMSDAEVAEIADLISQINTVDTESTYSNDSLETKTSSNPVSQSNPSTTNTCKVSAINNRITDFGYLCDYSRFGYNRVYSV